MSRVQLALDVADIDTAVEFYSKLFGTEPGRTRPRVSHDRRWGHLARRRRRPGIRLAGGGQPIPLGEGNLLEAASQHRIWMATVNGLFGSPDGGRRWYAARNINHFDGQGAFAASSFVTAGVGWLLVPGRGLWQTTDGRSWRVVSGTGWYSYSPLPTCQASQLSLVVFGGGVGNPGEALTAVRIVNRSSRPCALVGRPKVTVSTGGTGSLSPGGQNDGTTAFAGSPRTVTLGRPKAITTSLRTYPPVSAGFLIASRDVGTTVGGPPCPFVSSIAVLLPEAGPMLLHLTVHFNLCGSPPPLAVSNVVGLAELLRYIG